MASVLIELPANTWVQVTTGSASGSVRHKEGLATIVYVESASQPVGYSEDTPVMEETRERDTWPYFSVASGEFIWAWSSRPAEVVVAEGV